MIHHLARICHSNYFSDHALTRLVRLTVETNLLTTTDGLVTLLIVAIFPNKNWYTCPTAFLGKLYSNTLLVSLNNRIYIRETNITPRKSPGVAVSLPTVSSSTVHVEDEKSQQEGRRIEEGP
ncbi:hypothetical protein BC826DRAFT_1044564, partial [Russula brevipes]